MLYKYRPGHIRDLPECRHRIRDQFAYDDRTLNELVSLWRELMLQHSCSVSVIEDTDRPKGQRIVWYCISVFISDEYARYLRTEAGPIVGLEVLTRRRQGPPPLLNQAQIRQANSRGGVTLLTLNSGTSAQIMEDETELPRIVRKVGDYMPWYIGSYRLKEIFIELYTEYEHRWAEGYGYHLRTECKDRRADHDPAWLQNGYRPCLYSTTRCEADLMVGHPITELFDYEPPCFFFTHLEQELLHIALFGGTDEEMADFLSVSLVTVKKRWLGIYENVGMVNAALFGGEDKEAKRGKEKKRHLLQYLQHHMAELRPVVRPE